MINQLPFFPSSLPDETLLSRISRYHLLSGNKTINLTFDELFSKAPFPLEQIVPPGIEVLAARLPGEQRDVLKKLVLENTLLPLFLPYLSPQKPNKNSVDPSELVSHIPRRVVGLHGEAHLCLHCVEEDKRKHGVPYWHRSHQIPGVTICWRHQAPLLSSCPVCDCPFLFTRKLLSTPWQACRCAWHPNQGEAPQSEPVAQDNPALEYAIFSHDLLTRNLPPLPPQQLFASYRTRAIQLGFKWGSRSSIEELQEAVVNYFGKPFLEYVDPAYGTKRCTNWLRLTSYQSALDMPVTRHILLSLYLFGSVEHLARKLSDQVKDPTSNEAQATNGTSKETESDLQQREVHRTKVLKTRQRHQASAPQALWKLAFKSMSWLYDNDRTWLQNNILQPETSPTTKTIGQADDDELLAPKVDSFAKSYLSQDTGKPLRLTIRRLLTGIGKRINRTYFDRERYPLTFERIDYNTESVWHFRARRILWAIQELQSLGELISASSIATLSGVSLYRVHDIIDYCEWHCETLSLQSNQIPSYLLKSGIPHNWPGPQRPDLQNNGGRRHRSQAQMEPKSYLDFILYPEPRKPYAWTKSKSLKTLP